MMDTEHGLPVIIFHSPLADDAPADELDVLDEASFFSEGLKSIGYKVMTMPFCYDLQDLEKILNDHKPTLVINLVETLFSSGRFVHFAPAMLEHACVPFTGCSSEALYITSHKILAKRCMLANNIPTPAFYDQESLISLNTHVEDRSFIIKSVWEHASFGLDETQTLLYAGTEKLATKFAGKGNKLEGFFAEEYVHGREFNLSIIGSLNSPEVLPIAEMCFDYPAGKPRILGYRAKWDNDSFEYKHTYRRFLPVNQEAELQRELSDIGIKCWTAFGLKGYARIDFRVDSSGQVYVLEINSNPCISDDSGFVAAARQAGLTQEQLIQQIIDAV